MKHDLLKAALAYAARGWAVFPVLDKRPLAGSRGFHDATTDPRELRRLFAHARDANGIAVRCDSERGPVVIDVDGPSGRDELARLARRYGELPPTREATSGRPGRRHLYFAPNGARLKRTIRINDTALDLLGDGGYCVLPPSIHPKTGQPYRWTRKIACAALPSWVTRVVSPDGAAPRAPAAPLPDVIHEGRRDELLTSLAGSARRRGASEAGILALLTEENATRCDPPLDEQSLAKIARSIAKKPPMPFDFAEPINDANLARRFAELEHAHLRYCKAQKRWYAWDGTRWAQDDMGEAERRVEAMIRDAFNLLETVPDAAARQTLFKELNKRMNHRKLCDVLDRARTQAKLIIAPDLLDADPELLNVENGTLDLRTGRLRPHDPADLITKLAPVEFDPQARAPRWARFVREIMPTEENAAEVSHLQRAVGYSLTGLVKEHVFFFCYGDGANGKTTLLETLYALFGDYATTIDFELLLQKRYGGGDHRDLPRLSKARFVSANETPLRARWDERMLKQLTGNDTLGGRWLYGEKFDFKPTHTLWCRGNDRPRTHDASKGFWRRMRLVPFAQVFEGKREELGLQETLIAGELPGILNWALAGCRAWYAGGLGPPSPSVARATDRYQKEQHPLAPFLDKHCARHPQAWTATGALHARFTEWWRETYGPRVVAPSKAEFSAQLGSVPGLRAHKRKRAGRKKRNGWDGIGLKGSPRGGA